VSDADIVRLPSLPDVIYERLRREIATGQLRPGPLKLRPLAERFGTSPIPVREALRRLEADRLVSFVGNRAIQVNEVSPKELDEVFAIRAELETLALRLAMPALKEPERLAELERLMDRMDEQVDDPAEWRTTNEEFHKTLYEAAESPRLVGLINNLWIVVEPYMRMYVRSLPGLRESQKQHREIVEHVVAGDTAAAQGVLREHLEGTRLVVLEQMAS
jgi:DNA-binding GntR family transcriptional regulator